jgi:hypothetical protein
MMKLIPFLRFGGTPSEEEQDDELDLPPPELLEPPVDEETEEDEEEQEEEMEKEEDKKDGPEGAPMNDDSEMLKVFMTVEEEFVDNSGLVSQIEDVSVDELLQELHLLASAFGIRVEATLDEAV